MPTVNAPFVHTTDWSNPVNGARAAQSRGKRVHQARGSWLEDLSLRGKCVTLCFKCAARWSPKANRYAAAEAIPGWKECFAECDGCRNEARCTLYKPEDK